MNRSILIVICDFLLVSLLAFSTVDPEALTGDMNDRRVKQDLTFTGPDSRQDLASVMKLALDDERQARDLLLGELERTRASLGQQQTNLSERDRQLLDRERQLQALQQSLQNKDQLARRLAGERTTLEQQIALAQTNYQNLQRQLAASATAVDLSRELASTTREELRREQEKTVALQQQLSRLESSNRVVQGEKQQLAAQLLVTEAEKKAVAAEAARMQDEVKVVRQEKDRLTQHADKLADGVKTLASKSGELTQEIRENRPMAANAIFQQFSTNRVHARFHAYRPGMLGLDHIRRKETDTILASDGTNYYALCHIEDTSLTLANPSTDWVSLSGALSRNDAQFPMRALSFALMDPRIVLMPVTAAQAKQLGCHVYRLAQDPFKFQEAILVGAGEGYYGECKFEIDLSTPHYVKMDRSLFRGLFGKFNPTRGDLVLSKNGELLGIMANNTYCLRLFNFSTMASVTCANDVREQHTGELLSRLYVLVTQLPSKLH
jgi:X-X-X-Leu-X-X-Gly heptad repeat protein